MKSTAYGAINNPSAEARAFARSDRWKAWPFFLLMLSTSLPLNYSLAESRQLATAEVAELTQAAASSANSMSSIGYVVFLASLYLAAGWMIARKPKTVGALLGRQWPLLLLLVFAGVSVAWSYFPAKVIANIAHNFGILFLALAAALRYRHDPWLFAKHLGYVLGVNMLFHVGAILLIPAYTIDWAGRWHGMATTANTLGALALTTLWANAAMLICRDNEKDRFHLHLFFAGLAVVAMLGANSVTSILVSLCTLILLYLFTKFRKLGLGANFYIGASLIFLLLALAAPFLRDALNVNDMFAILGRDPNLTGRTSVWEAAVAAITAQPIAGWSFDDHAYLLANTNLPYSSYHNGYLDLAVCGGAVALLLFALLLWRWVMEFFKPSRIARDIAPLSAAFMIAFLIHNLSEASLVSPRGQLWQILLVLIFLGACKRIPVDTDSNANAAKALAPGAAPPGRPLQLQPMWSRAAQ
ncbi:hypothetical protein BH11PSE11_BH11PSE11_38410 [soil metagenome]